MAYSTLGCPVTNEVDVACRRAAEILAGITNEATPTEVTEPFELKLAETTFHQLRAILLAQSMADFGTEEVASFKPELRWNIAMANELGDDTLAELASLAAAAGRRIHGQMTETFSEHDVLLTPATLDSAFDALLRYPTAQFGSGATDATSPPFRNYLEWMLPTTLVSATSCPALVMRVGTTADGRPIGAQIVGGPGKDEQVLSAAAALERRLPAAFGKPSEPRIGTCPLRATGPRSVDEAERHHAEAAAHFRREYLPTKE